MSWEKTIESLLIKKIKIQIIYMFSELRRESWVEFGPFWLLNCETTFYLITHIFYRKNCKLFQETSMQFEWVLLFILRYIAVCNPYKYREKNIKNINASFFRSLLLIITASGTVNVTRFLETKIVSIDVLSEDNLTKTQTFAYEVTPLRLDPNYIR